MNKPKFYYRPYQTTKFWSPSLKEYRYYKNTKCEDWIHPNVPSPGECLTIEEILNKIPKGLPKQQCPLIMRFEVTEMPGKDRVGLDKWNGTIFVDIDAQHSESLMKIKDPTKRMQFFEQLKFVLEKKHPDNFMYIEHSSSGVGIHMLFYYDCPKTREYFDKAAEYTKNILLNLSEIPGFSDAIQEFEINQDTGNKEMTLDPVYMRPYQKCFITGRDGYINVDYTGKIDKAELDKCKVKRITPIVDKTTSFSIKKVDIKGMKRTGHMDRFKLYTAVKRITPNRTECENLWCELCKHFKPYTKPGEYHTYETFIKEFDYDQIDETKADISLLSKYGIYVDDTKIYHHLHDNQYLGNVLDKLLEESPIGVSLWQAPTGSGKTTAWTDLNKKMLDEIKTNKETLVGDKNKPTLIIEPLNSIINTKYDDDVKIVIGSDKFPEKLGGYGTWVTNYNKLLDTRDGITYTLKDNVDELLEQFGLIVIDESHTIIKDKFRSNVLIPFVELINKIAETNKVILQTATPMHEEYLLNIKRTIVITKKPKCEINMSFLRFDNSGGRHYGGADLLGLVRECVEEHQKVYIYWNNADLNRLKQFRAIYDDPEKVAIYHKANKGDISMERIDKYHVLSSKNYHGDEEIEEYDYDVLLSSVYFGVGNDLNDVEDACVIIIGNNSWQEDIQAIGRFRNSKHIDVIEILRPYDYEYLFETSKHTKKFDTILFERRRRNSALYVDKKNRSALTVQRAACKLVDETYIRALSIMEAADEYDTSFKTKLKMLTDPYYGINVDKDFEQFLDYDDEDVENSKEYWKSVTEIRNKLKRDIVMGMHIEQSVIDADPKLRNFNKLYKRLKRLGVNKILDVKYIVQSSKFNILKLFCDLFEKFKNRGSNYTNKDFDYAELAAMLWLTKQKFEEKTVEMFGGEMPDKTYKFILAYVMFVSRCNKDWNDYKLMADHYKKFHWNASLFIAMPEELIDMFWHTGEYDALQEFIDNCLMPDDMLGVKTSRAKVTCLDDIFAQLKTNAIYLLDNSKEIIYTVKRCCKISGVSEKINKSEAGKAGGKAGVKKCVILKAMPDKTLFKYGLNVGDEFESCDELRKHISVGKSTISAWRDKKWIE